MDPAAVVTPPYVAGPLRLAPFRALRLAPTRISDPASARAFARPYKGVAARLERWRERGLLTHDDTSALYLHEYTGSGMVVRGLVGALDVSRRATTAAQRAVLPHEGIYPAQADDLADRMAEMGLNPAPILLVQRSPQELRTLLTSVRERTPEHRFSDRTGHAHRLWAIRDVEQLERIATLLAPTNALIADGHHRYAAYLRLQQRDPGSACDRGLAMLVDHGDTPLFLGAIHRVLVGTSLTDVADAAASLGISATAATQEQAVAALAPTTLVATDNEGWLVIHLGSEPSRLAVEVLHEQLVPALGHGPSKITYHHAVQGTLDRAGPELGTAVLMPAVDLDQVQRIVLADRLFPEKATSFQPKPPLGVLIRSLHDEASAPSSPPPPPAMRHPPPS